MRIFIISRGYPTDLYRMNGLFEFDQAKALKKLGHEVIFLVVDLRSVRRWRKWGRERKCLEGIKIEAINLPCGRIPHFLLYHIGCLGLRLLFRNCEKKYGSPDIIHSHFSDIAYITNEAISASVYIKVITEHSSSIHNGEISNKDKKRFKVAYGNADKVIAVSSDLAKKINTDYGVECVVIPNMVNTEELFVNQNNFEERKKQRVYTFVSVGNLNGKKGMRLLVESFVKTFSDCTDVKLIIIGEGIERQIIERYVIQNDFQDRIILLGLRSRKEIGSILQQSDCFVLASESETFGVAYIEAMACGLPVIATRCGGPEDFVNVQNGILVNVNDKIELQKALRFMKDNSRIKYDKKIISEGVSKKYSGAQIAGELEKLYMELLERRRSKK